MPNAFTSTLIAREVTVSNNHKSLFPADIWNYIVVSFLPAYSRVGKNSFHNTSKALSQKGFAALKKPTVKEVIESCQTPDDALNILSDPVLCDQFSFKEFLMVAGAHPLITKQLLEDLDFENPGYSGYLEALAFKNEESARLILKHIQVDNLLKFYIAKNHAALTKELVTNTTPIDLSQVLYANYNNLEHVAEILDVNIAMHMSFIARQIHFYDNPTFEKKLLLDDEFNSPFNKTKNLKMLVPLLQSEKNYGYHGEHSGSVCSEPIYFPFLCLMSKHGFAHEILDNPEFKLHLKGSHLVILGKYSVQVAKRILGDKELKDKLNKSQIILLSLGSEELAERLLDDTAVILTRDELLNVGSVTEKLARRILAKYELSGDELYILCHRFQVLEQEIFTDKKYQSKIASYEIKLRCSQINKESYGPGRDNLDILLKLSREGLESYCRQFASVKMMALKNPVLAKKVFSGSTKTLTAIKHSCYVSVNHSLSKALKERRINIDEHLKYRIRIHQKIINIATKLRQQRAQSQPTYLKQKMTQVLAMSIEHRSDALQRLAREDIKTILPHMDELNPVPTEFLQLMLQSSDIDFCIDALELVKKSYLRKENFQINKLPWEMKRSQEDENFVVDNKKIKRN